MNYTGITMPEEIKVVINNSNIGYVVDPNNKKSLESAINWAKSYNNYSPEIRTYKNGQFKIELDKSAGGSSQGGKLSFWMCNITPEDGKLFSVGISSEMLLELLKEETFIKGKCKSSLFFGRRGNKLGVYSVKSELYKKAVIDEDLRKNVSNKKTTKYIIGDIVETLTTKTVYLGTMYKHFDISAMRYNGYIYIYKNPKLIHIFANIEENGKLHLYESLFHDKKPLRVTTGHINILNIKEELEEFYRLYSEYRLHDEDYNKIVRKVIELQFNSSNNKLTSDEEILIQYRYSNSYRKVQLHYC